MRAVPESFAARLAGETTTLAHCWRLARADGVVLGFTDHDRDIGFGGVIYAAATGLDAAERTAELGFAVGGGEVAGALTSAAITGDDIMAGRYDGARVEIWLVDWRAPQHRLLLDVGSIGEVSRSDHAFTAELRSVMHRLDETRGGVYRAACAADLGDARCGVSLDRPEMRAAATVTAPGDGRSGFRCDGLAGYASGWFTHGRLVWTSGANVGAGFAVKLHHSLAGAVELLLWGETVQPLVAGDAFTVTAGCEKSLESCRDRFANTVNFRGFPHMPGNDFAIGRGGVSQGAMDGGSMFR